MGTTGTAAIALDSLYYRQHHCRMPTPVRSLRVPDDLWTAARDTAARRGELIGDVLIRALERYVHRHATKETAE